MLKRSLENPKTVLLVTELLRRNWAKFDPVTLAHLKQREFVEEDAMFVSALCSRRSGKTYGVVLKMLKTAMRFNDCVVLYIGLTKDDAKKIVLPYFKQIKKHYSLPLVINEHRNQVKLPNGSIIDIASSDLDGLAERFRGKNYPLVCIDEAQSYRIDMSYLINEVLIYCVAQWRSHGAGQICLTGTPRPVLSGYFYEVTEKNMHGFKNYYWTLFDNPHFKNPNEFLAEYLKKINATVDDPRVQRELFAKWVASDDELVYKITESNIIDRLPDVVNRVNDMVTILGFDLAFHPDDTAYVVIKYSKQLGKVFVIYAQSFKKQIIEDVAETLRELQKRFGVTIIVGDLGALGKMIAEELIRRYALPVKAADKKAKHFFIQQFNSDLACGNVLFLRESTQELINQSKKLAWQKGDEDKSAKNDLLDAMLYAWRYSYHYLREEKNEVVDPFEEKMLLKHYEEGAERW